MRAAIYARVSDKSQDTEDKTSISEQIADMEAYCEKRGLNITPATRRSVEVVQETSGVQRMLDDAKRDRFDTIVCWKSDRLSRGMFPAAALMEVIEAHQIRLEAVMDAIDMKTFASWRPSARSSWTTSGSGPPWASGDRPSRDACLSVRPLRIPHRRRRQTGSP